MLRRGATAIHYVCEEIQEGSEVDVAIDWSRRFDHMQQHSGKHFYMISSLLVGLSPLHRFLQAIPVKLVMIKNMVSLQGFLFSLSQRFCYVCLLHP